MMDLETAAERFNWDEKSTDAVRELEDLAGSLGIREYLLGKETSMLEADRETYRETSRQRGIPKHKLFQPNYSESVMRLIPAFSNQALTHYFWWHLAWNVGAEPRFNHGGRMIYCGYRVSLEAQLMPDRLLKVSGNKIFGINLKDQSGDIKEVLDLAYSSPQRFELL